MNELSHEYYISKYFYVNHRIMLLFGKPLPGWKRVNVDDLALKYVLPIPIKNSLASLRDEAVYILD